MNCFKASIPIVKALCDETRLHILSMLSKAELNACEINRAFECTQPTISYHMRLLVDTELVLSRREGCQVIYSSNPAIWPAVQSLLTVLCNAHRATGFASSIDPAAGPTGFASPIESSVDSPIDSATEETTPTPDCFKGDVL